MNESTYPIEMIVIVGAIVMALVVYLWLLFRPEKKPAASKTCRCGKPNMRLKEVHENCPKPWMPWA